MQRDMDVKGQVRFLMK